jgi:hypothetical protein
LSAVSCTKELSRSACICAKQGVANHEGALIEVHPFLDPLRGDPRFEGLVQKVVGPKQK